MKKEDFIDYCNKYLEIPSYKIDEALCVMDECRCPLHMAGNTIVNRIRDLADEFEVENDLSDDWFYENFDDEEEVFWKLDDLNK